MKMSETWTMRVCGALCLCCLLLASAGWSGDVEDFFIQHHQDRYFDFPQDARTLALSGSNLPTASDLSSVFGNPAGLGFIDSCGLSATYSRNEISGEEYLQDTGHSNFRGVDEDYDIGTVRLALPVRAGGTLGLGWSGWDSDVNDYENTSTEKNIFQIGYGARLNECMSFGYSLSYFHDDVDAEWGDYEMDDGFRHTFGLQCRPNTCTAIGLSGFFASGDPESDVAVIGPQDGDRDSWGLELGTSCQVFERTRFTGSVDYTEYKLDSTYVNDRMQLNQNEDESGKSWTFRTGVEQRCCNWMVARAGYLYRDNEYDFNDAGVASSLSESADYHALSTGFGFDLRKNLTLDYAFQYRFIGDGDVTNTVTATFHF